MEQATGGNWDKGSHPTRTKRKHSRMTRSWRAARWKCFPNLLFLCTITISRWRMTPLVVFTGARAETLTRVWWPDRWGERTSSVAESGIRPHCGQIIYSSSVSRGQILFSVCLAQFDLFNQWVVTGDSRRPGPWHHVLTTRGLELPNGTLLMEDYTHTHHCRRRQWQCFLGTWLLQSSRMETVLYWVWGEDIVPKRSTF